MAPPGTVFIAAMMSFVGDMIDEEKHPGAKLEQTASSPQRVGRLPQALLR
jgi:hypothetical protein